MKKVVVLLLMVVMSMNLFAAAKAEADTEEKVVEITWWAAWGEDTGPGEMIARFNELYPNINITYVKFSNSDDGNIKIDTSLLAGEDVHVFFNYGAKRLAPRAEKGLVQDLTKFIERDGFDVEQELGRGSYRLDGHYNALPVGSLSSLVYLNMDALEHAGLGIPDVNWTLADYAEYSRKMTSGAGTEKIYGSSDSNALYYWTQPVVGLLGSNAWYNTAGLSNFDHEAYKRALEFKYNLENIEKTQLPFTEIKASKIDYVSEFLNGKIGMIVQSNAIARTIKNPEANPGNFKITMAPLPALEEGQSVNYNRGMYYFDYLAMGANLREEEKEASWTFMKWLATEGSIGLAKVGHIPTWKKTDKDALVDIMLGENAEGLVDIDRFKAIVLDYDSPCFNDTVFTANGEVYTILQEEAEKALFDQISIDQALKNMKTRCDQAIRSVQ